MKILIMHPIHTVLGKGKVTKIQRNLTKTIEVIGLTNFILEIELYIFTL